MRDLKELRSEIDKLDRQITDLFSRRMDCSKEVGEYKKSHNIPILNEEREKEILNRIEKEGGEYGTFSRLLYSNIMQLSREVQHDIVSSGALLRNEIASAPGTVPTENITIAVQGIKGANSHEAAMSIFGENADIAFFNSFASVFNAIENETADFGVLPVENSSAGSVSDVYDLILRHRFYIIDALDLRIDHCLCGLKQSTAEDIEYVWSHPQALAQCSNFINENNLQAIPYPNTAVAAKEIFREKRLNCAALCSEVAAKEYGLKILKKDFQNNRANTTRFIVISKKLYIPPDACKISLCFSLPHVTGSLYTVLCRFNSLGLNLTKIESRPMDSKYFDYLFYLVFTGNVSDKRVLSLLCALSVELPEFSFFGNYNERKAEPKK